MNNLVAPQAVKKKKQEVSYLHRTHTSKDTHAPQVSSVSAYFAADGHLDVETSNVFERTHDDFTAIGSALLPCNELSSVNFVSVRFVRAIRFLRTHEIFSRK